MATAAQEPRTATVRDLRNRFADVAKWIEDGEQVIITRHGVAFATLTPSRPEKPRSIKSNAFRRYWLKLLFVVPTCLLLLGSCSKYEELLPSRIDQAFRYCFGFALPASGVIRHASRTKGFDTVSIIIIELSDDDFSKGLEALAKMERVPIATAREYAFELKDKIPKDVDFFVRIPESSKFIHCGASKTSRTFWIVITAV